MKVFGASALPTACLREAWSRPAASPPKAAPACAVCRTAITALGKSGKCRSCAAKTRAPAKNFAPRVAKCVDCGTGITATSRTGRCKVCATIHNNRLPETIRKRKAGWKKRLAKPGERERLSKQVQRNREKAMCDPEKRARAVERGKWLIENVIRTPEVQARLREGHKKCGPKISAHRMAWCPPEYRELHRQNMATHRMRLAESRAMIEKLAAKDALEHRAARHPCFESVIDFMRRFTAVFDHGPVEEKRYRVGLVDLTAGELLQRAEFRGYSYPQFPQPSAIARGNEKATLAA